MKVSNWNGRPEVKNARILPFKKGTLSNVDFCPRGNGRSYGDASLQETMIDMSCCKEVLELKNTHLTVSSGFTVRDILNYCVPKGFILPVIPGTQHATVGGMIAADVHGKNHEKNGSLGCWIQSMEIQGMNGEIQQCSPDQNTLLFEATIGGLGLTGVIISATFKLIKLNTTVFEQRVQSLPSLQKLIEALDKSAADYKTGWFDFHLPNRYLLLENSPQKGTSIPPHFQLKKPKLHIPFKSFPFVQTRLMKIYNKRYARKTVNSTQEFVLDDVLFPLDSISNWNYLYGKRGFYQLQFSLPADKIDPSIQKIMQEILNSKFIPVLAVVKKHGDITSPGTLSFLKPGISFAFDFIYKKGLEDFLRQLNSQIAQLGGRVYLVKDALLDAPTFEKMYPEATTFKLQLATLHDTKNKGTIRSLLSKRLNLTP